MRIRRSRRYSTMTTATLTTSVRTMSMLPSLPMEAAIRRRPSPPPLAVVVVGVGGGLDPAAPSHISTPDGPSIVAGAWRDVRVDEASRHAGPPSPYWPPAHERPPVWAGGLPMMPVPVDAATTTTTTTSNSVRYDERRLCTSRRSFPPDVRIPRRGMAAVASRWHCCAYGPTGGQYCRTMRIAAWRPNW